ncbi:MAG: zf-HC2 domain-containing protein [Chloroflexi bacterium]|nr:zf-HC2 domain-containing protein [Chloroflexota bacterium]
MAEEITCKELVELVTDYLEEALPTEQRARFEAHLSRCEGCQSYFAQMRRTILLLGRLTEDTVPPAAKAELLTLFRNWKESGESDPPAPAE